MIFDYDKIPYEILPAFKGGEKEYHVKRYIGSGVTIMRGHLEPGASIGEHTHIDTSETIYIISGVANAVCDGKDERLTPGMVHLCPSGSTHSLRNLDPTPLDFFAVVAKA